MTALALAPSRLTVQYGSFTLDESNGIILSSEYDADDTSVYGSFYIEFRVRQKAPSGGSTGTDDSNFASKIAAVETALRIPRQTLLVKIGTETVRNWCYDVGPTPSAGALTAIMIEPELRLLEQNARDYRYGFRVRCQFPSNVPGNLFRRESLTTVGTNLRERRMVTIQAAFTADEDDTAYAKYLAIGDEFYNDYLPENVADQHGNSGLWVLADEKVSYNDETINDAVGGTACTVTLTFWEVHAGRRDSEQVTITTIDKLRICRIQGTWASTKGNTSGADGATALQNYSAHGDAYFTAILSAVPGGAPTWVQVDEEPVYNDAADIVTVTRVYHEVPSSGLRDYEVTETTDEAGLRTVAVSVVYYATTGGTAKAHYDTNMQTFVNAVLSGRGITRYESHSVPKIERYDTTGLRYFATWTIHEIAYPQSSSVDDSSIIFETLDVSTSIPYGPMSIPDSISLTRLQTCEARFVASIDYQTAQDPVALWAAGLRDHVITAVTSKLGATVTAVNVVDEQIGAGLHKNQLVGVLRMIVSGGSVLSLMIRQKLTQVPGRDFAGRGDGTAWDYKAYRDLPEKLLYREAVMEYVVGGSPPDPFGSTSVSSFTMIDPGVTAQDNVDAQNAPADLTLNAWFIDRRAAEPYSEENIPTTRADPAGTVFETVVHIRRENWRYVESLS